MENIKQETIKPETVARAVRLLIELYAEQNGVGVEITEKPTKQ